MNIIPIHPATLDIIEVLNDGVRPSLDTVEDTFFVYKGPDEHAEIVTTADLQKYPEEEWTVIKVLHK